MKSQEKRKHHYVPQFLLRNFLPVGARSLHAFDKSSSRSFAIAVSDAAAEKGYNSFDAGSFIGCAEDIFTRIESGACPIIRKLIDSRSVPDMTDMERAQLFTFLTAQMLRSKNHRAVFKQLGDHMRDIADTRGTPEFRRWVGDYDPEVEKRAQLLGFREELLAMTPCFLDKDILLLSTPPEHPFIIGDSPLVRNNDFDKSELRGTLGLMCEGVEVYLPLTPTLMLAAMCPTIRSTFENAIRRHGRKAPDFSFDYLLAIEKGRNLQINPDNVKYQNSLQVIAAERFVYSSLDAFEMVREMVCAHPELRVGQRVTMSGPGSQDHRA